MFLKKRCVAVLATVLLAASSVSAQVFTVTNTDTSATTVGSLLYEANLANAYGGAATLSLQSGLGTIVLDPGAFTLQNSHGGSLVGNGNSITGYLTVNTGSFTLGDGVSTVSLQGTAGPFTYATAATPGSTGLTFTSSATLHILAGATTSGGGPGLAVDQNNYVGGNGGDGVDITNGGTLINSGTVNAGGSNPDFVVSTFTPGRSGYGVALTNGGTVINNGTITSSDGGSAVYVANAAGTLVNQTGGHISNGVTMGNYANNVTLQMGSTITGGLNMGTSTLSTLTLADSSSGSGGTQSFSAAVDNLTSFGSIIKTGSGTWMIDQSLPNISGLTISAGTLMFNNSSQYFHAPVIDNSTLMFIDGATFTPAISGTGKVIIDINNSMSLTGQSTFTGGLTVHNGFLTLGDGTNAASLGGSSSVPAVTVDTSDTVTVNANASINGGAGGGVKFTAQGALTNAGAISGGVVMGNGVNYVTLDIGGSITGGLNVGTNAGSQMSLSDTGSGGTQLYSAAAGGGTTFFGSIDKYGGGTWVMDQSLPNITGINIHSGALQVGGNTGGIPVLGGSIYNGATLLLNAGDNVSSTFTQSVGGDGSIIKTGNGTVTWAGNNSYGPGISVSAGKLILGDGTNSVSFGGPGDGPAVQVNNGAALALGANATIVFNNQPSDYGVLLTAGGSFTNGGNTWNVTYQNGGGSFTNLNGGSISDYVTMDTNSVNNVTLQVGSVVGSSVEGGTPATGNLNIGTNSASTLTLTDDGSGGTQNYSGAVIGSTTFHGLLIKNGSSTWVLDHISFGDTTGALINAGVLQLGNGSTSSFSGSAVIAASASLVFDNSSQQTFANTISGLGSIATINTGGLNLTGANVFGGTITSSGGQLLLGDGIVTATYGGASSAPAVTVNHSGTLIVMSHVSLNTSALFSNGGTLTNAGSIPGVSFTNGAGSLTNSGSIAGVSFGNGVASLTNSGTITGGVVMGDYANTVNLMKGGSVAGGLSTGNGASAVNVQIGSVLTGGLNLGTNSAAQLNLTDDGTGGTQLYSTAIVGGTTSNGYLTKSNSGTWVIDQSLPNTARVLISAGTLQLGTGGSSLPTLGGHIENNSTLVLNSSSNFTFGYSMTGSGVLIQNGTGAITFTGNSTWDGGTVINAGTLIVGDGTQATALSGYHNGYALTINPNGALQLLANASVVGLGGQGGVNFAGNATLTSYGSISSGNLGGSDGPIAPDYQLPAGTALNFAASGTLTNSASITGGSGGDYAVYAGAGGTAISIAGSGAVTNNPGGIITAGRGGIGTGRTFGGAVGIAGAGGAGVALAGGGTVANAGTISGGAGGYGTIDLYYTNIAATGGLGGSGVALTVTGAVTNTRTGVISGGAGGNSYTFYSSSVGGNGAAGVSLMGGGTLTNAGAISAGNGGAGDAGTGTGGTAAIVAAGGTIINSGTMKGGDGGAGGFSNGYYRYPANGGIGGNGVSMTAGGTLINSGSISAGSGGVSVYGGVTGANGTGVVFANAAGNFTNQDGGTITRGVSMGNFANAVTLQIGSSISGGLNIGTSSLSTLTLTDDGSAGTGTFSTAVSGGATFSGSLIKSGAGTWVLDQSFASLASVTLNLGELSVSADNLLGGSSTPLNFNGGVLQVTGTTFNSTSRTINWGTNGGGFDIVNAGNTFTATQNLSYGGTLTKLGAGTLVLSGSGDNAALSVVANAGMLVLGKSTTSSVHAVGAGGLIINTGATVQLAGNGGDQIYDGGGVSINGGTFDLNSQSETINTLTGSGTVTNSSGAAVGVLTVTGGSFSGTMIGTSSNGISLAMNGGGNTLALSGGTDNGYLGVTVNAGTVVLGKTSSGTVHAVGNGLTINTGGTAQLGGTGSLNGSNVDQIYDGNTVTLNGGVFDMNGRSETIGALAGNTGLVTDTASGVSTLTITGGGTFGGSITDGAGQMALVKTGNNTLTLTGNANPFTGSTTVSAGTLVIGGAIASRTVTLDGSSNPASLKLMLATSLGIQAAVIVNAADSPTILLDFNGNQTVSTLQINGQFVLPGIYGTSNQSVLDNALFTSDPGYAGTFTVLVPEPSAGAILLLVTTGMMARRKQRSTCLYTRR